MNKFRIGIILGIFSGMSWGLNTVIVGIILMSPFFVPYSSNLFISALTIAFLHDFFSAMWLILNLIRTRKIKQILIPLRKKLGIIMMLSAILGGPIGMAGYLMGVKYIGPSYTASFSALYPALGTVLSVLILKEKINNRMIMGILVSGFGILFLSYSPVDIHIYPKYLLGIFFSFFCIFGWALECVVASYSMRYGEVISSVAICLRQISSSIFYAFIIIPYIGAYPLVIKLFNHNIVILIAVTALIGSISYLFWYQSIEYIGAPRGMSLNITYIIWTMIFEKIYFNTELSLQFILASIIVMFGIILIAGNPKDMVKKK